MNAQHHPDTPRTNAVRIGPDHKHKYWEDFARELERENAKLGKALTALVTTYAERGSGTFGPEEPLWEEARQAIGR